MDARRELVFAPKAKEILNKIKEFNMDVNKIADIGAGYGIFWRSGRKYQIQKL